MGVEQSGRPRRRVTTVIIVVVVIVGCGKAVWDLVLRDRLVPKNWGVVVPGLVFRSGQLSRHMVKATLDRHGIKVVVDLTSFTDGDVDQLAQIQACKELGIERMVLGITTVRL